MGITVAIILLGVIYLGCAAATQRNAEAVVREHRSSDPLEQHVRQRRYSDDIKHVYGEGAYGAPSYSSYGELWKGSGGWGSKSKLGWPRLGYGSIAHGTNWGPGYVGGYSDGAIKGKEGVSWVHRVKKAAPDYAYGRRRDTGKGYAKEVPRPGYGPLDGQYSRYGFGQKDAKEVPGQSYSYSDAKDDYGKYASGSGYADKDGIGWGHGNKKVYVHGEGVLKSKLEQHDVHRPAKIEKPVNIYIEGYLDHKDNIHWNTNSLKIEPIHKYDIFKGSYDGDWKGSYGKIDSPGYGSQWGLNDKVESAYGDSVLKGKYDGGWGYNDAKLKPVYGREDGSIDGKYGKVTSPHGDDVFKGKYSDYQGYGDGSYKGSDYNSHWQSEDGKYGTDGYGAKDVSKGKDSGPWGYNQGHDIGDQWGRKDVKDASPHGDSDQGDVKAAPFYGDVHPDIKDIGHGDYSEVKPEPVLKGHHKAVSIVGKKGKKVINKPELGDRNGAKGIASDAKEMESTAPATPSKPASKYVPPEPKEDEKPKDDSGAPTAGDTKPATK